MSVLNGWLHSLYIFYRYPFFPQDSQIGILFLYLEEGYVSYFRHTQRKWVLRTGVAGPATWRPWIWVLIHLSQGKSGKENVKMEPTVQLYHFCWWSMSAWGAWTRKRGAGGKAGHHTSHWLSLALKLEAQPKVKHVLSLNNQILAVWVWLLQRFWILDLSLIQS